MGCYNLYALEKVYLEQTLLLGNTHSSTPLAIDGLKVGE
jgi:hypothetical protein